MNIDSKSYFLFLIILVFLCVGVALKINAVDNSLTVEDKEYIPIYLNGVKLVSNKSTYEEELNFIISVQNAVLEVAPKMEGLPFSTKREPKELYLAKKGLCFDRSRVIEKILRYSGFVVRHISIYSLEDNSNIVETLLTPSVPSHAITEVLTKKGWLVVDSNDRWVSTDTNLLPVSIKAIQKSVESKDTIIWFDNPPTNIYTNPFVLVYGLYSRHGYFYPPYNFIPDMNYKELFFNISQLQ